MTFATEFYYEIIQFDIRERILEFSEMKVEFLALEWEIFPLKISK